MVIEEGKAGQMIKDFREANGLSQKELSTASRMTTTSISLWETGTTEPGLNSFIRVMRAMGYRVVVEMDA